MIPIRQFRAIWIWLFFLLTCLVIISRAHFTTDLSAFLPRTPTAQQQLLMDQLRDGLASRLILVGIEGEDPASRAQLSIKMAQQLRANPDFVSINNGVDVYTSNDRAYLFNHRYLLSNNVTAEHFSVQGLHAALSDSIDLLASPAGMLVKSLLPHDPSGEMMQTLDQVSRANSPKLIDGAWASTAGNRALLLVQTRASGSDTDAQQRAMAAIQQAYSQAGGGHSGSRLIMTGPGVFSVLARDTIKSQVTKLSFISIALIATLLLLVYRSSVALLLGFLPVISGALAGIAAVSIGFGAVHGITLGFGTALIGEAVDYSIYLFIQSEQGANRDDWIHRFWPVIRLGVLTSVAGFASLLLSSFPGLAQLGLYAITGLVVAAGVTRFVLPRLLPANFHIYDVTPIGVILSNLSHRSHRLRWAILLLSIIACSVLYLHRNNLWSHNLSSLSPVSALDQANDAQLRADMGAPDVRYLIVISAGSEQAALVSAERVSAQLQPLVTSHELAGFDSASRYLPSAATQRLRQASLPDADTLSLRLTQAVTDLPVHAQLFAPFIADVATARSQPLLQRKDLDNTSMAMAVDGLLLHQGNHWSALLPLTANATGVIPDAPVIAALQRSGQKNAVFVDLKTESDRLYASYLTQAIKLSLAGLVAIIGLLLYTLRSIRRVSRVVAPLAAAVITVTAGLSLFGQPLIIMHLVGLLLVVAIGSNYALFFDRGGNHAGIPPRTLASLFLANLTTLAGFGLLAFSSVPILTAIGITVAPGVVFALLYSAILSGYPKVSA